MKKWLGIPNLKSYEKYIREWHQFLQTCEEAMKTLDDENQRIFQLYILRTFYQTPYQLCGRERAEKEDVYLRFYQELSMRMKKLKEQLGL